MNLDTRHRRALLAAAIFVASSAAVAQSALFMPNNSAGTPIDPPAVISAPPPESARGMPSRTDSSLSAFGKLDWENRGYVTRSDANQLPGTVNFDSADRDRDGRLDIDEFQRFWQDYEGSSQ